MSKGKTLPVIIKDLRNYGRAPETYPTIAITVTNVKYDAKGKFLLLNAQVQGSKIYNATIRFNQVETTDSKGIEIADTLIKPIDLNKSSVQLFCSCSDYNFRFAYHNHKNGANLGTPKKYERVTSDRPSVNPDGNMGFCKHIWSFIQGLSSAGLFKL